MMQTAKSIAHSNGSATDSKRDRRVAARTGTLIASIVCLAVGSGPLNTTWGKADPKGAQNRRSEATPSDRGEQDMSSRATTPEYSSPNADYAVTGQLSRTTAEGDGIDADVPWGGGLTRRLWENRMAAPDPNEDADSRASLNDLIRRLRSVRFEDGASEPAFTAPTEPTTPTQYAPVAGPTRQVQTSQAAPVPTPTGPTEPAASLAPETQQKLDEVLSDPNKVHDPLEMAELLFLSGRQAEATIFYEKALARTAPNDSTTEDDRAWILFQLGNCLRETDMARARDMYMKLVSEYPGSPWTELAKAHGRLITWYQSARPEQLMSPPESQ